MTSWLIDKSAVVRLAASPDAAAWAARVERGLVRITTVTRLEVGYSSRSGPHLRAELSRPPLASMPVEYATPAIEDRAVEVLALLADRGQHRAQVGRRCSTSAADRGRGPESVSMIRRPSSSRPVAVPSTGSPAGRVARTWRPTVSQAAR